LRNKNSEKKILKKKFEIFFSKFFFSKCFKFGDYLGDEVEVDWEVGGWLELKRHGFERERESVDGNNVLRYVSASYGWFYKG